MKGWVAGKLAGATRHDSGRDTTLKATRTLVITMATWEWIALGLGILALLQLVALQYARRVSGDEGEGNGPQPAASGPLEAAPDSDPDREPVEPQDAEDEVVCPHCGATNDSYYTYCRGCVNAIP